MDARSTASYQSRIESLPNYMVQNILPFLTRSDRCSFLATNVILRGTVTTCWMNLRHDTPLDHIQVIKKEAILFGKRAERECRNRDSLRDGGQMRRFHIRARQVQLVKDCLRGAMFFGYCSPEGVVPGEKALTIQLADFALDEQEEATLHEYREKIRDNPFLTAQLLFGPVKARELFPPSSS